MNAPLTLVSLLFTDNANNNENAKSAVVKQTVQKEERFITEIRRLREENEELMQQLYASSGEKTDQDSLKSSCPSLVMTQGGASSSVVGDLDSNSLLGNSWDVMFQTSSSQPLTAASSSSSASASPAAYDSDDDNSSTNADDLDLNGAAATSSKLTIVFASPSCI